MRQTTPPPDGVASRPLVVCVDGPRSGAWYFATGGDESWAGLRRIALDQGEDPTTSRTLGYVRTRDMVDHPRWVGIAGTVLRWNPETAKNAL